MRNNKSTLPVHGLMSGRGCSHHAKSLQAQPNNKTLFNLSHRISYYMSYEHEGNVS